MGLIVGLSIALLSIAGSIYHLRQNPSVYFDFVGFVVVMGGTGAVATMLIPWDLRREFGRAFRFMMGFGSQDPKTVVLEGLSLIRALQEGRAAETRLPGMPGRVLREGAELLQLGFQGEKAERILVERIEQNHLRLGNLSNMLRSLAKYPPAFGLVGTVLGLVSLMRAVSDGASSQETGLRMAVALVATLYGLLLANLILNPAGERMQKFAIDEKKYAEVALEAVLLASEGVSLLEAQETLNSFVMESERVDLMGSMTDQAGAEAA